MHFYVWYRIKDPKDDIRCFLMAQLVGDKGDYFTFIQHRYLWPNRIERRFYRVAKKKVMEMQAIRRDKLVVFCGKVGIILQLLAKWKKDPKLRELEFSPREWQDLASTMIISAKEFI